jgi:H+/Cl- antiporter ClcA
MSQALDVTSTPAQQQMKGDSATLPISDPLLYGGGPLRQLSTTIRLGLCVVLVGIGAGLGSMGLALLLHGIQHFTYGYDTGQWLGRDSFLQGVGMAGPWRRLAALTGAGLVAGLGWFAVARWGRPLVSVRGAVAGKIMSPGSSIVHALLQIVTVAMGSPLGREVAPREVGALAAQRLGSALRLGADQVRVLAACGAGAGLAAIYNVPFAGALFVLEVLLAELSASLAIQALVACGVATWVAHLGLGDEMQYHIPAYTLSNGLLAWSVLAGPILGAAAMGYRRLTARMRARAAQGAMIVPCCLAAFVLTGLLATMFPGLPGNGKGPLQSVLVDGMTLQGAAIMLVLKLVVTAACLRAGAQGGLLTPGLTVGGLLSTVLALGLRLGGIGLDAGACACVGAAAFLGVSMQMPLTALMLMLGFTGMSSDFLLPIMIASCGAWLAAYWIKHIQDCRTTA